MNDSPFDFGGILAPYLPAKGVAVAVGVSGGPDSMALCRVLSQYATGPVHAVTVDHGLRPEAAQEAAQVGAWLAGWNDVQHIILKREKAGATRLQEKAREDRYALMAEYCAQNDIDAVFTAHHQDDQAETFLFRLAKGSGLDGLGAMRSVHAYNDTLKIIRPFLDVPKSALVSYCETHSLPFVTDPSNEDSRFARVRLRDSYEILNREGLSTKRLAVTASRLARARDALDFYAGRILAQAIFENERNRIVLQSALVISEPEEVRLRVLAGLIDRLAAKREYGPRLERLEELSLQVFGDPGFKKASLAGCLVGFDRKNGLITVETEQKGLN